MTTLQAMRNDYEDDEAILNKLKTNPESVIDFDLNWNGSWKFLRCGDCSGPMLGHRIEKCREKEGDYAGDIVKKYENTLRSKAEIREIMIQYIERMQERKEQRDYDRTKSTPTQPSVLMEKQKFQNGQDKILKYGKRSQKIGMKMKDLQKNQSTVM